METELSGTLINKRVVDWVTVSDLVTEISYCEEWVDGRILSER